jgi:hypothetical protein
MKLDRVEQLPIYHPGGLGNAFSAFAAIAEISGNSGETLKLCFNGTLVTVKPDMTEGQIAEQWDKDRSDYQKRIGQAHPALCPVCLERR